MAGPRRSQRLAERKNSITSDSHDIHTNKAQVKSATLSLDHSGISVPQEQGPKPQTSEGATAKLGSSIISETSGNMIRVSQHCVLYRFPPEIRKEIFRAAIDLFFDEFYGREDICYHIDVDGQFHTCLLKMHRTPMASRPTTKVFGGLREEHLSALEAALFPDTALHGEFIATRIEKSTLALLPALVRNDELGYGYDYVVWPQVDEICPKVRSMVRSVTYVLDVGAVQVHTDQFEIHYDHQNFDVWNRMSGLGDALNKLRAKAPTATSGVDSQASSLQPKSGCELLPRLRTVVIRFPDNSFERELDFFLPLESYKIFQKERGKFLEGLKKLVNSARIKSLQLEDLRDFKFLYYSWSGGSLADSGDESESGSRLMDEGAPRFRKFTTSLNKAFGILCKDETDFDHLGYIGQQGVYKAKETWTATGDFLVWRD